MSQIKDDNLVNENGGEKARWNNYRPYPYIAVLLTDIIYPVGGVTSGESVKQRLPTEFHDINIWQIVNGNFNIYNSTGSKITTERNRQFA